MLEESSAAAEADFTLGLKDPEIRTSLETVSLLLEVKIQTRLKCCDLSILPTGPAARFYFN